MSGKPTHCQKVVTAMPHMIAEYPSVYAYSSFMTATGQTQAEYHGISHHLLKDHAHVSPYQSCWTHRRLWSRGSVKAMDKEPEHIFDLSLMVDEIPRLRLFMRPHTHPHGKPF